MRISDWSSDVCSSDLALGVGVADLDGLAGHAGDHVGRAVGVAVDRVLDRRYHHDEVDRQLHLHRRDKGADDGGAAAHVVLHLLDTALRSEEHTSELQSLMRISYAVFCLKKKKYNKYS